MALPAALLAAGPIASGLFGLIDKLFTSDDERMAAKLKVLELEKSGELAQIAVNAQEAQHASIFIAGWRPFVGWVCGLAFTWAFLLYPMLSFFVVAFGLPVDLTLVPELDLAAMMPVLMGMLGLGAMRSWEKREGVARERLDAVTPGGVDRRANSGGS